MRVSVKRRPATQVVQFCVGPFTINMTLDGDIPADRSIEPDVAYALCNILQPGDVVIDGGACHGYLTLVMAAMIGEQGRIIAFEPALDNIDRLRRNLDLNMVSDVVEVIDKPLWSRVESKTLYSYEEAGLNSLVGGDKAIGTKVFKSIGAKEATTSTIDALGVKPRLIKLDIEGAEVEALKGAVKTVCDSGCYVICEANAAVLPLFGESGKSLIDFARDKFGYDAFMLSRFFSYPVFMPPGILVQTKFQDINILFATREMVAKAFPVMSVDDPLFWRMTTA